MKEEAKKCDQTTQIESEADEPIMSTLLKQYSTVLWILKSTSLLYEWSHLTLPGTLLEKGHEKHVQYSYFKDCLQTIYLKTKLMHKFNLNSQITLTAQLFRQLICGIFYNGTLYAGMTGVQRFPVIGFVQWIRLYLLASICGFPI